MGRMTQRVLNTREQCRIIMTSLLVIFSYIGSKICDIAIDIT